MPFKAIWLEIFYIFLPRCRNTAAAAAESSVELDTDMASSDMGFMCPTFWVFSTSSAIFL